MKTTVNTTILLAVLTTLLSGITPAAQPDPLLNMVPDDALFCLRINELNASLGRMDQYLMGASPLPVSLVMLVNMQIAGIVGDPMLTGLAFFVCQQHTPEAFWKPDYQRHRNGAQRIAAVTLLKSFSTLLTVSASSAESSIRSPSSLPESTIVTAPRSAGLS